MPNYKWHVFLSHAHEDRAVALALRAALEKHDLRVWMDDRLEIGDRLTEKIDEALRSSRFGVILVSPRSLRKQWTIRELGILASRESAGETVILPVLHEVTPEEVSAASVDLGGRVTISTGVGLDVVAQSIVVVVRNDRRASAWEKYVGVGLSMFMMAAVGLFAWQRPDPTPFQFFVMSVLLALGAAGFVSILPGRFTFRVRRMLQATASLGVLVFVLVLARDYRPAVDVKGDGPPGGAAAGTSAPGAVTGSPVVKPDTPPAPAPVVDTPASKAPQRGRVAASETSEKGSAATPPGPTRPVERPSRPAEALAKRESVPAAGDLSHWDDVSDLDARRIPPAMLVTLLSANCRSELSYDDLGRIALSTPQVRRFKLWSNSDATLSFLDPDERYALAWTSTGVRMARVSNDVGPKDDLPVEFRFRSRVRFVAPDYMPGADYVKGCSGGIRQNEARLLEPVAAPGRVLVWQRNGLGLGTPPEQIGPPLAFERSAVTLITVRIR